MSSDRRKPYFILGLYLILAGLYFMLWLYFHRPCWREFATRAYYEVGFATQLARRAIHILADLYLSYTFILFWRKRPLVPLYFSSCFPQPEPSYTY
ncbi:hypothetical protein [Pontibacter flavimaris]|uniref:hypothetical protein n=1 Tax=Pontibacter flavimaris TaxID=1797110 RepID=UPI001115378B|nr:hypothetical protein [Pontibacter flavimaris]